MPSDADRGETRMMITLHLRAQPRGVNIYKDRAAVRGEDKKESETAKGREEGGGRA